MRNDFCTDYLAHGYLAHGKEWGSHKYVAKYKNGNRYIYFYSQAAYQAFLKRRGAGSNAVPSSQIGAKNYDPNAPKAGASKTSTNSKSPSIKPSAQNTATVKATLSAKNNTTNANKKTASEVTLSETKDKQDRGKELVDRVLNAKGTSKSKKSGSSSKSSSSSKKSGSSSKSSGSSKKSSGTSTKEKTGSGSSKSSSANKEAKTATTAATQKATTTTQQKTSSGSAEKVTMDTLKKVYGKEDKDVSSFDGSASDFKKDMLSKYEDGSYGYLMAGGKAYKWTIENGDIILKDYDSDKEVSFDEYLKDAKSFKEFNTSKKKTK